jgi:2-oxoglutarate ferredoxin oxidoreductase subunit alpha
MRTLLMTECGFHPEKLASILDFDGMPITADFITDRLEKGLTELSPLISTTQETKGGTV